MLVHLRNNNTNAIKYYYSYNPSKLKSKYTWLWGGRLIRRLPPARVVAFLHVVLVRAQVLEFKFQVQSGM